LKKLIDWIFYKKCYFCGKKSKIGIICDECFKKITIKSAKPYKFYKKVEIFSACSYENDVKKMIRGLKYHDKKEFAGHSADILYKFWGQSGKEKVNFSIIPMPSHLNRLKKRKYNHTELIADEFSLKTGYKVNKELLYRIKDTKPQYKLSIKERKANLRGAFRIDINKYAFENLLLLDDICTTGTTVEEAIDCFLKMGINKICVLVLSNPEFD